MKLYGNLCNRIDENKNYTGREIRVGDDITMYYWSDRNCYYVTKVIDQKHIFVHRYEVCADHSKHGGMGHQNWLYFKTIREEREYLNKFFEPKPLDEIIESNDEEWVFRYGKWYGVCKTDYLGRPLSKPQYYKLQPISFGVRDYYYDWEF